MLVLCVGEEQEKRTDPLNNVLVDYHLHSTYSADGFSSIADCCHRAFQLGFVEIGFCEHADFDPRDPCYDYLDFAAFRQQIEIQRERFGHGLAARAAVEVTYQTSREEVIALFLADKDLDYVVGSVHLVEDAVDWAMISEAEGCEHYFARRTMQVAYRPYFVELRRAVASGLFDVIGHFDLVKRYGVGYYGPFDPTVFSDRIHDILELAVEKGVGLEINTSGLRQAPRETYPALGILKCYRQLGGDVLTVGSDAHSVADLGRGIVQALALARQAGFRAITLFEERKPRWVDIG